MSAHYIHRVRDLPHVIYCLDAIHGRPLYVGCTYNLERRISQHMMEQPWWHEVADVRVVASLPNRTEGLLEEVRQIREIRPAYNLSGRLPRRDWTLDDYLNTISGGLKHFVACGWGDHDCRPSHVAREMASRYGVAVSGATIREALTCVEVLREERRISTRVPIEDAA